jgi:hypothetical protein
MNNLQIVSAAFILMHALKKRKSRRDRRWWISQLYKNNKNRGVIFLNDMLMDENRLFFQNFTRMSPQDFEYLLTLVEMNVYRGRILCSRIQLFLIFFFKTFF